MSEEGSEGAEGSKGSEGEGEIQTRKSFCWVIALEMASAGVPVCHIDDDDAVAGESDVGWSGCCWSDGAATASVLLSIVIWDGAWRWLSGFTLRVIGFLRGLGSRSDAGYKYARIYLLYVCIYLHV